MIMGAGLDMPSFDFEMAQAFLVGAGFAMLLIVIMRPRIKCRP